MFFYDVGCSASIAQDDIVLEELCVCMNVGSGGTRLIRETVRAFCYPELYLNCQLAPPENSVGPEDLGKEEKDP